jgi:flagellar biosynthetic protein FliR
MWDAAFDRYTVFLLLFVRMSGLLLFNPFLGRKSVPAAVKGGLALLLALPAAALYTGPDVTVSGVPELMLFSVKELLIGFLAGMVLELFLSAVLIAGDLADLQLGIGMAKVYDPAANASIPISASFYNLLFTTLFFLADGHLSFIRMMFYSVHMLPPGPALFGEEAFAYVVSLFGSILVLALKIAMPMIGVEVLAEFGLGILMRTVPQINVFVVGLQLKLLIGLVLFSLLVPGLAHVFDAMTGVLFEKIEEGIRLLV